jgi:predicted ABC-type ATPase
MAQELAPGAVASVAIKAGRMTLDLMQELFVGKKDFALETTLSGRLHQAIIKQAHEQNYHVVLIYVWVNSPRISVKRVKNRVRLGGHYVSSDDISRRYKRGIANLFSIYMDLCDQWAIIDNTDPPQKLVASGMNSIDFKIYNPEIWKQIISVHDDIQRRA